MGAYQQGVGTLNLDRRDGDSPGFWEKGRKVKVSPKQPGAEGKGYRSATDSKAGRMRSGEGPLRGVLLKGEITGSESRPPGLKSIVLPKIFQFLCQRGVRSIFYDPSAGLPSIPKRGSCSKL